MRGKKEYPLTERDTRLLIAIQKAKDKRWRNYYRRKKLW